MPPGLVMASMAFPLWLRLTHFINLLFIGLVIRSGLQIAGAHPRLYWNDGCDPESAWLNLVRKKVPKDELYTSMDDEVSVPTWLALPGRDNLGLGRHWHFFSAAIWVLNGVVYVVLLFATGEWQALIPTSWSIFPAAWHTLLIYLSFHVPPKSVFHPFDPLQQLSYAGVVFLLAPFMLLTGAAMSPAIEAQFPWYIKLFGGRQSARSLHFLSLIAFLLFIVVHTATVIIVYFPDNIRNIVFGSPQSSFAEAVAIAVAALVLVAMVYVWASWQTLRTPRAVQHALGAVVDPLRLALLHRAVSKQTYKPSDISPYFWINGRAPDTEDYRELAQGGFESWRLHLGGLVQNKLELSLEDLRAFPRQTQITKHNCIQGWSGIAEWGGVCLREVLDRCGPLPQAKYLVVTSYQLGRQSVKPELKEAQDLPFYEIIDMELARHPQTILAYEMNGAPLPVAHGAPLRLRVETQLGYKMVKYLHSIELVEDYRGIGGGQGGFREDVQYYGRSAEI